MFVCTWFSVGMYVCMYVPGLVWVCTYVPGLVWVCTYMYVCTYVCMYVCTHVCLIRTYYVHTYSSCACFLSHSRHVRTYVRVLSEQVYDLSVCTYTCGEFFIEK